MKKDIMTVDEIRKKQWKDRKEFLCKMYMLSDRNMKVMARLLNYNKFSLYTVENRYNFVLDSIGTDIDNFTPMTFKEFLEKQKQEMIAYLKEAYVYCGKSVVNMSIVVDHYESSLHRWNRHLYPFYEINQERSRQTKEGRKKHGHLR